MSSLVAKFKGMAVKRKMLAGFGVILLILGLIAVQTLFSLLSMKDATTDVVQNRQQTVITSMRLAENVKDALGGLGFFLLSKDQRHKQQYLAHLKMADAQLQRLKNLPTIRANPQAAKLVTKIVDDVKQFKSYQDEMFTLAANQDKNFPAISYAAQNINPLSRQILQNLNTMIRSEENRMAHPPRVAMLQLLNNMRYAWARVMSGVRSYLGFRSKRSIEDIREQHDYFMNQLQQLKKHYGDHLTFEQSGAMDVLNRIIPAFTKHLAHIIKQEHSDQWRQDAYLVRTKITPLMTMLNDDIQHLVHMQVADINNISSGLMRKATETAAFVTVMLLLAMGAVATLAFLLMRGIIRPMTDTVKAGLDAIRNVVDSFSDDFGAAPIFSKAGGKDEIGNVAATFRMMSSALQTAIRLQRQATDELRSKVDIILEAVKKAAQGDLTSHLQEFHGQDAIDELAANVQTMIENLNALVAQVQQSGIQVTTSATQIAATAKQQEATATEQAASTSQIMATVTEISATTKGLVTTMEEVSEVADNAAQSAGEGQAALSRMESTMRQMRDATDSITAKLAVLNEKASNINNVVTTINKVADQTNLLSLNAAIEAEKAGEYGRGFAVVATEIRRLADQTAVATWDIEQMVKEMQSAVSAGVMGMDKFSEEVSRGAAEVGQVGSQLTGVIDQVQTLTPRFDSVNQGMQAQAQAAGQISESMRQLNETAQQTAESLRQSNESIQQLKDAAQGLQSGVRKFRVAAE